MHQHNGRHMATSVFQQAERLYPKVKSTLAM